MMLPTISDVIAGVAAKVSDSAPLVAVEVSVPDVPTPVEPT